MAAAGAQRGLAADLDNEEFYIGGWNSNQIWRTTFDGTTISTFGFSGVSGLAWQPMGGPDEEGALWVVVNAATDNVTEVDPNNGWATIQAFVMPDDQGYSGAGMEIKISTPDAGALWIPNQSTNQIYLVDDVGQSSAVLSNPRQVYPNIADAAMQAIEALGADRVCFGSDGPFQWPHVIRATYEAAMEGKLSVEEQALVMGGNIARLFGL